MHSRPTRPPRSRSGRIQLAILTASLAVVSVLARPPVGASESAALSSVQLEQRIDSSIDLGVEYLLTQIASPSGWAPTEQYTSGYIALQLYALLKNGVSYLHPEIQRGLDLLSRCPLEKVYSVSLGLMAQDAILDQIDREERDGGTRALVQKASRYDRQRATRAARKKASGSMERSLDWLLRARVRSRGVWGYGVATRRKPPREVYYDHSNTQFAVLALGVARRRGLDVPESVWEEVAEQFISAQEADGPAVDGRPVFSPGDNDAAADRAIRRDPRGQRGSTIRVPAGARLYRGDVEVRARGWGYTEFRPDTRTTFSMTSAGQSSALLARIHMGRHGRQQTRTALERAIRDGYAWITSYLDSGRSLPADPYALYSLEKVGDIGEVERFGTYGWFEIGARILLDSQGEEGQWGRTGSTPSRHKTALALLYLGRASALEHHRGLVRYTGGKREGEASFTNRYLVRVRSLDASVPVIRFFRQLRYQPDEELVQLGEELLTAWDPEYLDELALFLRTLDLSPFPAARRHGRALLERLTGLRDAEPADYMAWAERWAEVRRIAKGGSVEGAGQLVEWLRVAGTKSLKLRIVRALQSLRCRAATPDLIRLLRSDDADVRRSVFDALVVVTGATLAFDPEGPENERASQIDRWEIWWQENPPDRPPIAGEE